MYSWKGNKSLLCLSYQKAMLITLLPWSQPPGCPFAHIFLPLTEKKMPCCQSPSLPTGVEVAILMIIPLERLTVRVKIFPAVSMTQGDLRPEAWPLCASSLCWMNSGIASCLHPADVIWELGLMLAGKLGKVVPCCSRDQKTSQLGLKKRNTNMEHCPEDREKRDTGCLSHPFTRQFCPSLNSLKWQSQLDDHC